MTVRLQVGVTGMGAVTRGGRVATLWMMTTTTTMMAAEALVRVNRNLFSLRVCVLVCVPW